ncbi:C2 domain containing protein [Oryctes borbonicus]|uniref:C2 domain containing protein n=1 Tax=Oryctes borbonicus TaxID=1629725 RepID=A0A0T6B1B7_9SCAR|nr:C2 domain containing protein [Oryctes borbonicus]
MRTSDPVWEEGFTFLIRNPETDTVYVQINDQKTGSELGSLDVNLSSLSNKANLEIVKQPFTLSKSGPYSKIILSLRLRILKNASNPEIQSDQPEVSPNDSPSASNVNLEQQSTSTVNDFPANLIDADANSLAESIEEGPIKETSSLISATPTGSSTSVIHRTPSVTSSSGEAGLGRIQLTLRYSIQRQRLTVVVNQVANIPLKDPSNIPDPYVKLYLLPGRAKDTKRKTAVIKDNCNPIFDEKFEYLISQGELNTQQLEVTVCTQKQLFYSSSNVMGQVIIDLSQWNLMQPLSSWFDLQPEK